MADFTSFPFLPPIDPLMEPINQIALENPNLMNLQSFMSNSSLFSHHHHQAPPDHISGNWADNFPGFGNQNSVPEQPQTIVTGKVESIESKKRKTMDFSESSSGNSSPHQASITRINKRNNCGKGKRVKSNDEKNEKSKDVVHVRARRGQATDSHSLAERVRRGKINEKLKCLQDIVPGCYKTMGMAVMLDEIINYVQSLQNQVEFLSMKLTTASTYYDFNSETEAIETIQRAKAEEAKELERLMREAVAGYQGPSCFNY